MNILFSFFFFKYQDRRKIGAARQTREMGGKEFKAEGR